MSRVGGGDAQAAATMAMSGRSRAALVAEGDRHGAAARDRRRLRHHGRAARGRERRASRCSRTRSRPGAALVALILTFGPISGAHFNPAVTLADASQGGLPWRDVPGYVAAQIVGAFAGRVVGARHVRAAAAHALDARAQRAARSSSASSSRRSACWRSSGDARAGAAGRVPFAVGGLHHGGLLVHGVDVVRQSRRDARARADRHVRRHPPGRRARLHRRASSLGAAAATLLFRWLVPALPTADQVVASRAREHVR